MAICNIKAVERVDKYVFGSKHVLQIMIDKGNRPDCAIYMKLKVHPHPNLCMFKNKLPSLRLTFLGYPALKLPSSLPTDSE